jgi:hypothetical protein
MPFIAGALSVRRYAVIGEISPEFAQIATNAIRRYTFQPVNDEKNERESFGWVNPRALLNNKFGYEDVVDGSLIFLGARRDRKSFSKVLFRARLVEKMEGVKRVKKMEKISRQHRLALEEELSIEMLRETSPVSSFYELIWDMSRGEALFGVTGGAACDRVKDLFEATFDLRLAPRHPALVGAEFIASQGLEAEFKETLTSREIAAAAKSDEEA